MEMVMKKSFKTYVLLVAMLFFIVPTALAEEGASAQEVYELTLKAYSVIESLGADALPAFNDPKGEFSYKDTYVAVTICPGKIVGHPAYEKLKDVDMDAKYSWFHLLCEAAATPNGQWVEYQWVQRGETEPSRKLSFSIGVKGTPYTLTTGIYSETESLETLNAALK